MSDETKADRVMRFNPDGETVGSLPIVTVRDGGLPVDDIGYLLTSALPVEGLAVGGFLPNFGGEAVTELDPFESYAFAEPTPIRDATLDLTALAAGLTFRFAPQPDITAYEMAQLWSKVAVIASGKPVCGLADWLTSTGLVRHFEVR